MPLPKGTLGVLLDIEGTTTPITFVYDVLFPYAKSRLEAACQRASQNQSLRHAIELLREEHHREAPALGEALPPFGNGAPFALWLMEQDRKSTGLKALQGLIWEEGYRSGELKAEVFPDVFPALREWRERGIRLRIFSSGSVLAQKLLFGHTDHGDLTPHFEGYHDTTTGPKREARSYRAIAKAFNAPPETILFLSDMVEELDAASEAGMRTTLVVRPGNKPVGAHEHNVAWSFQELT